jgi:YVTN family beta-propeller protein
VLSPDGATLYVHTSNGIDVVNTATGTVTGTINAGTPIGVTPTGATLYAAASGKVQAISTATHAVTATIAVSAGQPADAVLSSDGTHVYVLNDQFEPTAQAVTTIDTATNTVTGTTTLGPGQWSNLATR